jgi:hypothetical protein
MSAMTIPRRGFLKKGLAGGALLVVGGGAGLALRSTRLGTPPRAPLKLLSPAQHAVLAAVAARVVPGDGAPAGWPTAEAVDCAGKIDALLTLAHPEVGVEFKQLLGLFENGLAGLFTRTGWAPFTRLSVGEQDARLRTWASSRLIVLRSGYQALVRLVHATYFSSPEVYPLLGYPGPPVVPA